MIIITEMIQITCMQKEFSCVTMVSIVSEW